jgi:hypothetical protein
MEETVWKTVTLHKPAAKQRRVRRNLMSVLLARLEVGSCQEQLLRQDGRGVEDGPAQVETAERTENTRFNYSRTKDVVMDHKHR